MIRDRSFTSTPFHSSSTPRAEQPREGHREPLHRSIVFLLSDEGEGSTGGEASLGSALSDPLPNLSLSPVHSVVNPQILGALEYMDHQLLDVGHRLAQTRINRCVPSMILMFLSPLESPETHTPAPPQKQQ